ncbi:conjugal transfer protein TrbL [Burkholderia singularis]|uniref:Conjugal transfer protein TrbL n=1 Tax=Burkholderia singularis TaxID=1503053 RepID=A0A118DPK8_9BURK|nr:type IV secretion system protein [Burkholderia singularis]KVE28147.1 conjugal transfer protein TrbL [Burkholderia singularis]
MAFNAATQIFTYLDDVTKNIVVTNVSNLIGWAAPLAGIGLTIVFMVDGLAALLRPGGDPLSSLFERFFKSYAIVAIAGAGGFYQTKLAATLLHLPDELATKLLLHGASGTSDNAVATMIDSAMDHSITILRNIFMASGVMTGGGLSDFVLAIVLVVATLLICGTGIASILLAKFLLILTVSFGPVFILMLLIPPLQSFFGNWLGDVLNYIILIALTAMTFGVVMHLYDKAITASATIDPNIPVIGPILTAGLITVVGVGLLRVLPNLAARWTGGVSTKLRELRPRPTQPPGNGGSGGGDRGAGSGSGAAGSGGYSLARGSQGSHNRGQ